VATANVERSSHRIPLAYPLLAHVASIHRAFIVQPLWKARASPPQIAGSCSVHGAPWNFLEHAQGSAHPGLTRRGGIAIVGTDDALLHHDLSKLLLRPVRGCVSERSDRTGFRSVIPAHQGQLPGGFFIAAKSFHQEHRWRSG
jgi:hypothetical protein